MAGTQALTMMLRLSLLGTFAVDIEGQSLTSWPRKSALQLLQLLAIAPEHRITRSQAAQALARDTGDEQLRQVSDALYALRGIATSALDCKLGDFLGASPEAIWLDTSKCRVDVIEFEQLANEALSADAPLQRLEAAVACCNGPLLAELSPVIEASVAPVRLHLEQLYLSCARALVAHYAQRDQNERMIVALHNVLRIVPSDEECHRQLIELFATLGRYHEAEQQLALCRIALARDLGLKPSAATIESIRAAREKRLAQREQPAQATVARADPPRRYAPPRSLVKLIGRDDLIASLVARLAASDSPRLLTLCGIGGIGKTQLALEVALRAAAGRQNGAVVVDLTRVADAAAVPRAIAMTLGLKRTDGRSWQERLQQHLEPLELLLVLDNFEHVHRAAPWLASLLEQVPLLTVLCTSRFPLLVRGEEVIDVDPLAIQRGAARNAAAADGRPSDSASLFLRAARSQRAHAIDALRDLALIEEICWRLDGLPLAIELAAARACVVGPRALLTELATRHVTLVNPMQNAPTRHTSLRELLESTCAILDRNCKIGLSYAAHFEAGFTLQQFADSRLFDAADSERILAQLLDARIVSIDGERGDARIAPAQPRFRLLETMRAYARHSGWMEQGIQHAVTTAFVEAWHRFAVRVAASRHTLAERACFDEFESEFENVSGAIRIAARGDRVRAREIVTALWTAAVRRGHIFDLIAWMEDEGLLHDMTGQSADEVNLAAAAGEVYRAAAKYPLAQRYGELAVRGATLPGVDAAAAHLAAAYAYLIQSELAVGTEHARIALTAALTNDDERAKLDAHILLTTIEHRRGEFVQARFHATTARDLCARRGIEIPIRLIGNLALSLRLGGDFGGAIALYATAAERCRTEGESRADAIMTLDQAECELLALQLDRAHDSLQRAGALVATYRMTILECVLHQQVGALQVLRGDAAAACAALDLSMKAMPAGSHFEQADITLLWLTHAQRLAGRFELALHSALRLTSGEAKVRRYIVPFVLESVAAVLQAGGQRDVATTLVETSGQLRRAHTLLAAPAEAALLADAGLRPAADADDWSERETVVTPEAALADCHALLQQLAGEGGGKSARRGALRPKASRVSVN